MPIEGESNPPLSARPAEEGRASTFLEYLPSAYGGDPFMARFLLIFEDILGPIEHTIDTLAHYFDPRLTPEELLPWLAAWVGMELDETWPVRQQRELILWAATLCRWRGTRRGLCEHLRLYTGRTPLVVEHLSGPDGLGEMHVGEILPWIHVTVLADRPDELDERVLRQIIEFQKPAHVACEIDVRRPDVGSPASPTD